MSTRLLPRLLGRSFAALLLVGGGLAPAHPAAASARMDGDGGAEVKGSRKKPKKDSARERIDWWRQRMGGELGPGFSAHLLKEAEKQRLVYSERFGPLAVKNNPLPEGLALPAAVSGTTWTSIGPTSSTKIQNGTTRTEINSGRLRTILPDSADPNVLYLLTAGGGLWKTSDLLSAEPTWTALTDALGSTAGGAAAFGQTTTGAGTEIYLGAGDAFDNNVGGFVTKSSDAGLTWSTPIQLAATSVLDLKVDLQGSGAADDVILVGTNNGLFRSTNGGAAYAAVADADVAGKYVWSIVKTSAGWLAAVEDYNVANGTGSLVLSTDFGATWAPVASPIAGIGRVTLGVGLPGDSVVYAYAANTGDNAQLDLYRSTNGGNAWSAVGLGSEIPTNSNTDQPDMDIMAGQAFYNHMILVDPTDTERDVVYLGGQLSTAKSTNALAANTSWTLLTNWLPRGTFASLPYAHADFHTAAFTNAGGTPRLLFGNDGGIAISSDGGTTWDHSKNKGITSHLIYAIASGPICNPHSTLAGLQDNGTHNRGHAGDPNGTGTVWDQTKGGDGFGVGWSQANNAASLATYVYNDIDRATSNPPDDQSKWSTFTTGLPGTPGNDGEYYFVTPIVTPPAGADASGTVFFSYSGQNLGAGSTASNRIFRSSNAGWTTIARADTVANTTAGLTTGRFVRAVSHGVGVHPTNLDRIAAAGNGGFILITTNGGTSWTESGLGYYTTDPADPPAGYHAGKLSTWAGFNANVEWVNDTTLYACSESTISGSTRVAKTTNLGSTWAPADAGLPDVPVTKIVCDRGDATGNTLYAATWLGVYRTTNGGVSWSLFGTGLPQVRITDLYVHPDSAFIRAATWGRGVWQLGTTPNYGTLSTTHPYGGSFTLGSPFSMSVAPIPSYPPRTFQWKRNGVNLSDGGAEGISGSTSATLTLATPTCASAGEYTVTVTNCTGTVTSNGAIWSPSTPAVAITAHPANTRIKATASFALKVTATGASSYQWRRNGVPLSNGGLFAGVDTNTLQVSNVASGDINSAEGSYTCVVTNSAGCSSTSNAAIVDKDGGGSDPAPNFVADVNPSSRRVSSGGSTTFAVTAGGGGANVGVNLAFQWRRNGVNLTNSGNSVWNASATVNATNSTSQASATSTLILSNLTQDGTYSCVVTSDAGSVTSGNASLVIEAYTPATAVSITPSPALPVTQGTPVTFTATGSGAFYSGTANPAPASAYLYEFWVYWDDYQGWTKVQDYSTSNTYTLPGSTAAGTYGVGVNVRTNSLVAWDVFNAIDYFTILPSGGLKAGPGGPAARTARPSFASLHVMGPDGKPVRRILP